MNSKKLLVGTTAIIGAGVLFAASSAQAFDVTVGGFGRLDVTLGDVEEQQGNPNVREFDFNTDFEAIVEARQTSAEHGITYGATIEFEGDTDATTNTDEAWLFVDGGFGGFRFGNEDGAADNMRLGAMSIAAGTGGIDGEGVVANAPFDIDDSGDSTKIRYDSPVVGGFQLGISYAPDEGGSGQTLSTDNTPGELEHFVEAGLVYTGSFSGVDLQLAGTGAVAQDEEGEDDFEGFNIGGIVGFSGFQVAGGYWAQDRDETGDLSGFTVGGAAGVGPADFSVTFAYAEDETGPEDVEPTNLVFSATVGLLPGLTLGGDISFFDNDTGGNDDGVTGAARIGVSF